MEFNIAKCFIMNISLATKNKVRHQYSMKGQSLSTTSHTKYLGVEISDDLKWNRHIDMISAKATNILNFVRRNLKNCPQHIRDKAYTVVPANSGECKDKPNNSTVEGIPLFQGVLFQSSSSH